jgi:hypothetical protein
MSQQKVTVRIFHRGSDGPKSSALYIFDPSEFNRLKQDFLAFLGQRQGLDGGTYRCDVIRDSGSADGPTELVLRFSEIVYIG